MKNVEYYQDREQTYIKHFFLERYLERVAYVIGYHHREFVYVDGFSGPWQSHDEEFEDTSFIIAIKKLRDVRDGLAQAGKPLRIRCLFIEKDETSFKALAAAIRNVTDLEVKPLHGTFESLIPNIMKFVGRSFSLVFIDPTGWTGFGMHTIAPILQHNPGEVIVNFMYDYINRFLEHPSSLIEASINRVFGGTVWREATEPGRDRENNILKCYRDCLRDRGCFRHVTSTRILKPLSDRSYFHLVYGTRHLKGLREFRGVEKGVAEEQERVRSDAKQRRRVGRSGQRELFSSEEISSSQSFQEERAAQLEAANRTLRKILCNRVRILYDDALGVLLEMPLVWESDVKDLIDTMRCCGELEVEGLKPRERTVKCDGGHTLVFNGSSSP